ncbi:hypothetical protein [Rhizobium sp. 1399]|uniref:hypothetical protein n=1 Tax=Rhizobium sp. 1399 TaxID=2817758 RepID=UPI002856F7A7|nr:hypothetical protein [Rhizobium sp. 1399]MDR6665244.1 hypothetical protein [Rhizobium sp. 1399]
MRDLLDTQLLRRGLIFGCHIARGRLGLFVVLSVAIQNYITSAQLTATFDVLWIGEENRVFSESLADAQHVCTAANQGQLRGRYEVALADKDGDIARLVIARRQIDYTEVKNFDLSAGRSQTHLPSSR